jgi:hypothetical protein
MCASSRLFLYFGSGVGGGRQCRKVCLNDCGSFNPHIKHIHIFLQNVEVPDYFKISLYFSLGTETVEARTTLLLLYWLVYVFVLSIKWAEGIKTNQPIIDRGI